MKILGYNYKVDKVRSVSELGGLVGRCFTGSQRISLAHDQPSDSFISVLIHELIEAVDYHLELKLRHPQIMALEVALFGILVENGVDLTPLLKNIIEKEE